MLLTDYEWFRNPRGMHNKNSYDPLRMVERYFLPQMGWAKLVVGSDEYINQCEKLLDNQCVPIIRIWRERFGASQAPEEFYQYIESYIERGAKWFEFYNEPNLDIEWPSGVYATWEDVAYIAPLMDHWLEWAERVIELGGYPGFTALADSNEGRHAAVPWLRAMFDYLRTTHNNRFRNIVANGMWAATHPYIINHFYQEPPGGPAHVARPYYQQRADEGGWHFEYPYDPLQQRYDPGRTVFGGTPQSPLGDPSGLIAMGVAFQTLLKEYFGMGPVPVVGTEGGTNDIPRKGGDPHIVDTRYPPYNHESHGEATLAMFEWIAREAPPWLFGVTLWREQDYYEFQGAVAAIDRLIETPVILKDVPPIGTASGTYTSVEEEYIPQSDREPYEPQPTPTRSPLAGPGPVSGSPDLHWLILAPGLQVDWFFEAARRYWQTFRPTVTTDWSLIEFVPHAKSLGVTVLARSDTAAYMEKVVAREWPNVYYDPLVFDALADMEEELNRRATYQRRFG